MRRALTEFEIEGVPNNIEEQLQIVGSTIFRNGVFGTDVLNFIRSEAP